MTLDLSDEEIAALLAELDRIIDGDRYPLSARIRMLKAIRAKIRPELSGSTVAARPSFRLADATDVPLIRTASVTKVNAGDARFISSRSRATLN